MSHEIDATQPLADALAQFELAVQRAGARAEQLAGLLEQMWQALEDLRQARRRERESAGTGDIPDVVDRLLQRLQEGVRGNIATLQSHEGRMLPVADLRTIQSALARVIESIPGSET